MAVAIPVIASFAAGAAAVTAAATATTVLGTVAAYAAVAGAVLTGVGAITGKKDLMKVGGILSLAGGVGSLAANASSGASSAAASGAAEGAASEAAGNIGAQEAFRASEIAAQNASTPLATGAASTSGSSVADGMMTTTDDLAAQTGQQSLMQQAQQGAAPQSSSFALKTGPVDKVAEAGSRIGQSDIQSFLDKAWQRTQSALKGTGEFLRDNKELVKLTGDTLNSMYGPEAELMDLKNKELQMRKSIMDRARLNLNQPIQLSYGG